MMATIGDLTLKFREAVRAAAVANGYDEVGLFLKACRDSIEALKNSIGMEEKQAHGANWLQALGRGSPNTDRIAHQHGVV